VIRFKWREQKEGEENLNYHYSLIVVVVKIDMLIKEVMKNMILNMIEWRRGIHVKHSD